MVTLTKKKKLRDVPEELFSYLGSTCPGCGASGHSGDDGDGWTISRCGTPLLQQAGPRHRSVACGPVSRPEKTNECREGSRRVEPRIRESISGSWPGFRIEGEETTTEGLGGLGNGVPVGGMELVVGPGDAESD